MVLVQRNGNQRELHQSARDIDGNNVENHHTNFVFDLFIAFAPPKTVNVTCR